MSPCLYGIRRNYKVLEVVFVVISWRHWLVRRTQDGRILWEVFDKKTPRDFPLPKAAPPPVGARRS